MMARASIVLMFGALMLVTERVIAGMVQCSALGCLR